LLLSELSSKLLELVAALVAALILIVDAF
jgi:hypothetical protein